MFVESVLYRMSKHINIDNEIRLFKYNIESLRITNIFKNRRINITTALIYYTTIIYIYLLTLSVAFFINPMPYEYFFYGVEMTTNILFLIVLGYRCQDVNDTLRMYKNDDIRMYNFNCITDTIVEVITTCNTYTLLTVHLL